MKKVFVVTDNKVIFEEFKKVASKKMMFYLNTFAVQKV